MNLSSLRPAHLLAISLFLTFSLGHAQGAMVSGKVDKVAGTVTLMTPGGELQKVTVGILIPTGSRIETGADGQVAVTWMEGATSVITSNTAVRVVSLLYSEPNGAPNRKIVLNLTRGSVTSKLAHGENDGKSDFRIKTPKGVVFAKGTKWQVTVGDDGAVTISVTEDIIGFVTLNNVDISIQQGDLYAISADGVGQATPLTDAQIASIVAILNGDGFNIAISAIGFIGLKEPLSITPIPGNKYVSP